VAADALSAGVAEDDRGAGNLQRVEHGLLADVGEVDEDAQALHLAHHILAEGVRPLCSGASVALSAQALFLKCDSVM
jgi:hypothetical protein